MLVIAFDPSYVVTGYAVVDSGKTLIAHGVLRVEGTCHSQRFVWLFDKVSELCRTFRPGRGVVEVPPPFAYERSTDEEGKPLNLAAIQKVGFATSVIMTALGKQEIKIVEAYAHKWKMMKGKNLNKAEMMDLARNIFPELKRRKITHHECEAVCMAALNY